MTVAVVPMKQIAQAKSRLASVLPPETRQSLARVMLAGVLTACRDCPDVQRTVLLTTDTSLTTLAKEHDADLFVEHHPVGLNAAMKAAAAALESQTLVYLAGDLPLLKARDISDLTDRCRTGSRVVIAPSADGNGTNALLLSPANILKPTFGHGSSERHEISAHRLGIEAAIVSNLNIGLDIDTPQDLETLLHHPNCADRYAFLHPYLAVAESSGLAEPNSYGGARRHA